MKENKHKKLHKQMPLYPYDGNAKIRQNLGINETESSSNVTWFLSKCMREKNQITSYMRYGHLNPLKTLTFKTRLNMKLQRWKMSESFILWLMAIRLCTNRKLTYHFSKHESNSHDQALVSLTPFLSIVGQPHNSFQQTQTITERYPQGSSIIRWNWTQTET
jgi:hypothetical protein